jgi:hypothetical protein
MSDIAKLVLADLDAMNEINLYIEIEQTIREIRSDLENITDVKEADRRLRALYEEMNEIYPMLSLKSTFYETYNLCSPPGTTQYDNTENEIKIQTLKTEIETLKTELQPKKKVDLDKFKYMKCN